MQAHHIIAGFSDIKTELRTRTRTDRPMLDLQLWFSLTDGTLYVHDFNLHKCCIIIALKSGDQWNIRLSPRTFGYKLIYETLRDFPAEELVDQLNGLNKEYGHYPPN